MQRPPGYFSILNRFDGRTFAVYASGSSEEFAQVNNLQKQGRVQSFGEANYVDGSHTAMWLQNAVTEIAEQIVNHREQALGEQDRSAAEASESLMNVDFAH